MPTGFTYTTYQQAVATYIPKNITDPDLVQALPIAIDYGELSILRDLDFLATHGNVALGTTFTGQNLLAVPAGVVVVEELYYGANNVPVPPLSQATIRAVYAGMTGPPQYYAVVGSASGSGWAPSQSILLGPAPDTGYAITAYATQRPASLSPTHTTTFISLNLPDVFFAATMIFWSAWMKNFGAQADDARQAVSWEAEYQRLLKSAAVEEMRKKSASQGWQSQMPAPLAAQPR